MSTYKKLLEFARDQLKESGISDADIDAWLLLAHAFGISRAWYYLHSDDEVSEADALRLLKLVKKRAMRIPLQHITGIQEFAGLEFEVNGDVLIPRQETELLVEEVLGVCDGKDVLDMCCGSGCIIISIARLGRPGRTVAADISEKALALAKKNAAKHQVNVEFVQSDLFAAIDGSFDIIVSNPPYIPSSEIESLMPEVRDHEPRLALDGTKDGLEFYRRIAAASGQHLKKGGRIYLEIGYNQAEAVTKLLSGAGFCDLNVKKDLSGHDRIVSARWL